MDPQAPEERFTPTRDFNKILNTVRNLIAKAEGTDNETEADAYRAKADKMMMDYAIEQAELDATKPAEFRIKPERLTFKICPSGHKLEQYFIDLVATIAAHVRCEVVYFNAYRKYGDTSAFCIGYSSDLQYLELLFTTLFLHMSGEVEPHPDHSKSFDENVHMLHEAGVKWARIANLMNHSFRTKPWNQGWRDAVKMGKDNDQDTLVPWPDGHRLINAYRRWCKEIGEEPRAIVSPIAWQRNFCDSYVGRISTRLWEMRQANPGTGGGLVLRQESVKEMMDEIFPPKDLKKHKQKRLDRYEGEARNSGRRAANTADLNASPRMKGSKTELG